ncbi:MAG: ATP-binding protein [Acidobacteriota bacterium]|jgi:DNA replication protein DnaC
MTTRTCKLCHGTGYIVSEREGALFARACSCREPDVTARLLKGASLPERYQNRCVLGAFKPQPGTSQGEALAVARRYAEEYPALADNRNGLMFMGPCGVGKTHLAVGILLEIIYKKNLPVRFVDLNDLYRHIQSTYGRGSTGENEYDIMGPLVEAPLLLVDELGCVASPWAQDTLHFLVNQRYNQQRPTLITTNYPVQPEAAGDPSLENRIGTRTLSRIYEMCRMVPMDGLDYRRYKRA